MPELGFCGPSYIAKSIYQEDQECINWYIESQPEKAPKPGSPAERGFWTLYPTPGLIALLTLPIPGEVRGLWARSDGQILYAVCVNKLYSITTSYIATEVGTLNSVTGVVSMVDNGSSLYLCDGPDRYYYTWASGTFAVVTDGAFNGADRVDFTDGFIIYNKPNSMLWGSTFALSVASSGLSFGAKDSSADNISTLIADHREAVLLGLLTTERYINTGAVPFPFERIPGVLIQHGCGAKHSVARFGESIAFLANDTRGQATVVHMNGYTPMRISTFAVEYALNNYTRIDDAIAYTYSQSGHEFYVLTLPTADVTWVYDLATQLWHKRGWRDTFNQMHRHRGNCFASFNGKIILGDYQNSKIYELSESTYDDDGSNIFRLRRTRHLTSDLKRQFFTDLQIQFQPGIGLQTGQGSDPQCMLAYSDDGGSTYNTQRTAKIGKVGQYKNRAIFRRLGTARDRIWELTVTDPINAVIVSSELNMIGGSVGNS